MGSAAPTPIASKPCARNAVTAEMHLRDDATSLRAKKKHAS